MWKWKLLKQAGVCLIIILVLSLANTVNIQPLNKGAEIVMAQLNKNYTGKEVAVIAKNGITAVAKAPVTLTNAVLSTKDSSKYGQPIEKSEQGKTVAVHAVYGGTVVNIGENDQIGKFVKISHSDGKVSLYGNCSSIHVKDSARVKKGEIIATYKNDGRTEFYYSLKEPN